MVEPSEVTVVVPCKNEEATVRPFCLSLMKQGYRLLVPIAKGSKDRTKQICDEIGAPNFKDGGRGKGEAIRMAIIRVGTPYVVFMDADGSHEVSDLKPMLEKMDGGDMVIGSRLMGGSMELYDGSIESFFRTMFTLCINQIVNIRFGARVTDTQNGFRGGRSASLKALGLKADSFDIETEMVMKMLKRKMKVAEVPSREYARKAGTSGVSMIMHGWRYILTVLANML